MFNFKNNVFGLQYILICVNRIRFRYLLRQVEKETCIESRLKMAQKLSSFAAFAGIGQYASTRIENIFASCASDIHIKQAEKSIPNSTLHVFSWIFLYGGHVRLCERIIKAAPQNEIHSVIVLNEVGDENVAPWFKDAVQKHNGEFILLESISELNRAARLRYEASKYSKIYLYTAENEGIVITALNENIKSPVVYINQADHCFWVGRSIADIVADIRPGDFTWVKRQIDNYVYLGLPLDNDITCVAGDDEKLGLRKELGIPYNKFVCISVGSYWKFCEVGQFSFLQFIQCLVKSEDLLVYVIGAPNDKNWETAAVKYSSQIVLLDRILDRELYYKYLRASDLLIDSFPMGGGTVRQDAIQSGIPVVSFTISKQKHFLLGRYLNDQLGNCYSEIELLKMINSLKKDSTLYRQLYLQERAHYYEENEETMWKLRLEEINHRCPEYHIVNNTYNDNMCIDDMTIALNKIYRHLAPEKLGDKMNFYDWCWHYFNNRLVRYSIDTIYICIRYIKYEYLSIKYKLIE